LRREQRFKEFNLSLSTEIINPQLYLYQSLPSTNEKAKELAFQGEEEGRVILARLQTQGKGREDRRWYSPPGGLWFSIILRPHLKIEKVPALGMVASIAISRAVEGVIPLITEFKWPNDILINNRKFSGVLLEIETSLEKLDFVIIGIGINVNQKSFPPYLPQATSLRIEIGERLSRLLLLKILLSEFDRAYSRFLRKGASPFISEYKTRSIVLGRDIKVQCGKELFSGKAVDISEEGSLILKDFKGRRFHLPTGTIIGID